MSNPVVHFEILGKDGLALQKYYADLFGWQVHNHAEMGNYGLIDAADGQIGGGIGASQDGAGLVTFYVEVDDPQVYLDKAVKAGGSVIQPVTDMGMVVVAMFADPEGHVIGLVKSAPQA